MINWIYTALIAIAVASCSLLLKRSQAALPLSGLQKLAIGMGAFVGALLMARLPFVIAAGSDFNTAGHTWFSDGKTIMCGIVGGYLGVEGVKWYLQIAAKTGDTFAFPVAVAVAIGRLACFSAGCCYGTETGLPWGVHFSVVDGDQAIFRHPTQIYEFMFHSVAAFLIYVGFQLLYSSDTRAAMKSDWFPKLFKGNLMKAYIIAYMLYRLVSETIRPEPLIEFGLTIYQMFAIILIPVFVALWIRDIRPSNNMALSDA